MMKHCGGILLFFTGFLVPCLSARSNNMHYYYELLERGCEYRGPNGTSALATCFRDAHDYFLQNCMGMSQYVYNRCANSSLSGTLFESWWSASFGWHLSFYQCLNDQQYLLIRTKRSAEKESKVSGENDGLKRDSPLLGGEAAMQIGLPEYHQGWNAFNAEERERYRHNKQDGGGWNMDDVNGAGFYQPVGNNRHEFAGQVVNMPPARPTASQKQGLSGVIRNGDEQSAFVIHQPLHFQNSNPVGHQSAAAEHLPIPPTENTVLRDWNDGGGPTAAQQLQREQNFQRQQQGRQPPPFPVGSMVNPTFGIQSQEQQQLPVLPTIADGRQTADRQQRFQGGRQQQQQFDNRRNFNNNPQQQQFLQQQQQNNRFNHQFGNNQNQQFGGPPRQINGFRNNNNNNNRGQVPFNDDFNDSNFFQGQRGNNFNNQNQFSRGRGRVRMFDNMDEYRQSRSGCLAETDRRLQACITRATDTNDPAFCPRFAPLSLPFHLAPVLCYLDAYQACYIFVTHS